MPTDILIEDLRLSFGCDVPMHSDIDLRSIMDKEIDLVLKRFISKKINENTTHIYINGMDNNFDLSKFVLEVLNISKFNEIYLDYKQSSAFTKQYLMKNSYSLDLDNAFQENVIMRVGEKTLFRDDLFGADIREMNEYYLNYISDIRRATNRYEIELRTEYTIPESISYHIIDSKHSIKYGDYIKQCRDEKVTKLLKI